MKLTKDTIKKLNKENIKIHINVIEEIDLNELVGQEINELSDKDFENTITNKKKNYFYTINDEKYYTTSSFRSLLNTAQLKTAHNNEQDEYGMNQEFDGYGEYDENNNVKECHCKHCTCKKELHLNNEFNMDGFVEFLKDSPVDDIPCVTIENKSTDDIPYIALEGTGKLSLYKENDIVKLYDKLIDLKEILGWKENKNYYSKERNKFYKIKDNSLYERDESKDDDSFELISEKYSEDLFNELKKAVRKDYYSYFEETEEYTKTLKLPIKKLTVEEFWNKLIEIERNDSNLDIKKCDKRKNILNYSTGFYYFMYSTMIYTERDAHNKLETKFKDNEDSIKYPIHYSDLGIFDTIADYEITGLKRFIKNRNVTDKLAKLINNGDYFGLEELLDNPSVEELKTIKDVANYYHTNYKTPLEYMLFERELEETGESEYDLITEYVLHHKNNMSKELVEDVELYKHNISEWCNKHQLPF